MTVSQHWYFHILVLQNQFLTYVKSYTHLLNAWVGFFRLQLDFRTLISFRSNRNGFEMHFGREFSPFRIETLTWSHLRTGYLLYFSTWDSGTLYHTSSILLIECSELLVSKELWLLWLLQACVDRLMGTKTMTWWWMALQPRTLTASLSAGGQFTTILLELSAFICLSVSFIKIKVYLLEQRLKYWKKDHQYRLMKREET